MKKSWVIGIVAVIIGIFDGIFYVESDILFGNAGHLISFLTLLVVWIVYIVFLLKYTSKKK